MADVSEESTTATGEEAPPLGSWRRMYAVVLGVLLVETLLFTLFTKIFE